MTTEPVRPLGDVDGYGQFCAIGLAMDTIGDRWTMLILRDLARTPLRVRDLEAINPGMSPNLLTLRLRKLEEAGIVEGQQEPNWGGHIYALTDETRAVLVPVLTAVANLGTFLVDRIAPEEMVAIDVPGVLMDQMNLNGHYVNARPSELAGHMVLDISGEPIHILITPGWFHASTEAPDTAQEVMSTLTFFSATVLMRIMARGLAIDEAETAGMLQVEGDRDAGLELLRLLSFGA